MDIGLAVPGDAAQLARLLWLHSSPEEQARQAVEPFALDFAVWWTDHAVSHLAFVARLPDSVVVGVAWLALLPRVPRPGVTTRRSADIQSVFVVPKERGKGIGAALVSAATAHASLLGVGRITVHSSHRAVPLYERLGFGSSPHLLLRPAEG